MSEKTVWDSLSYADKLAVTKYVFHVITSGQPCSFRYMIYKKLGFDHDAYVPLYRAGGMVISNALFTELENLGDSDGDRPFFPS